MRRTIEARSPLIRALLASVSAAALVAVGVFGAAGPAAASPVESYQTLPGGDYPIDLTVSPDGAFLYVIARGDGGQASLRTFDTATLTLVDEIVFGDPAAFNPTSVEVTNDGSQVWVSFYNPGQVWIYPAAQLDAGASPAPFKVSAGGGVVDLAADPSNPRMYAATLFNPQYQFTVPAAIGDPVASRTVDVDGGARGVAVGASGSTAYFSVPRPTPDGVVAAVAVAADGTLSLGDRTPTGDIPWGVVYNGAQNHVVSTNSGTTTSISAFTPGGAVTTVPVPCGPRNLDVGPAGQRVYIACLSGGIVVHDYAADTTGRVQIGDNVEAVEAVGPSGTTAQRVYATSGGTNQVLVFTKPVVTGGGDVSAALDATATFTSDADGFWQQTRWQISHDGGTTWTDVPGASGDSLDLPATTDNDGALVRQVASSLFFDDVAGAPMRLTVVMPSPTPTIIPCPEPTSTTTTCLPETGGTDSSWPLGLAGVLLAGGITALITSRRRAARR